jgi:uncharacterized membrane protein YecN with MAPEG domain
MAAPFVPVLPSRSIAAHGKIRLGKIRLGKIRLDGCGHVHLRYLYDVKIARMHEVDMHFPSVTEAYLAVLALLYAALGLQVARLRRRHRSAFGDGGNIDLRSAIRAHAHFAEYVPITVLMVALLESSGLGALKVHGLMATLLAARLLHPLGMYAKPGTLQFSVGRVGGMVLTNFVLIDCAVLILRGVLD